MANLRYNLVRLDDEATLTVFYDGKPYVATDTHPAWDAIVEGVVVNDDPEALDLFDATVALSKRFERLGERATVANGRVYFDGDEVDNALTKKIVEFLEAGVPDWKPLVNFMEKVYTNPEQYSREQMFEWLSRHAFSINEDGDILGYKSVQPTSREGFTYESITSGSDTVIVDGVEYTGHVPQNVGSVVEMPRSGVAFDPNKGCAAGLHVANFNYASTWAGSHNPVLLVAVNPRDVVSVPNDSRWEKVRVCRYRVVEIATGEPTGPLHREVEPEPEDDEPYVPQIGDHVRLTSPEYVSAYNPRERLPMGCFGVGVGSEGVVEHNVFSYSSDMEKDNVLVRFTNNSILWVAKDALEPVPTGLVQQDDDEDESWDFDDDDDDSWSW